MGYQLGQTVSQITVLLLFKKIRHLVQYFSEPVITL